jgi:hypothetical protein
LLDGLFFHHPAVTHREILSVIDRDITVIGAASMGAQRAAELRPFGMLGCGSVYQSILAGIVTDDSELAVGLCPFSHQGLTIPLVEIRRLLALVEADISQLSLAFQVAQDVHFLERTEDHLLKAWERACPDILPQLILAYAAGMWHLKSDDALLAIDLALATGVGGQTLVTSQMRKNISLYGDRSIVPVD